MRNEYENATQRVMVQLTGVSVAKNLNGGGHLLLADLVILLPLGHSLQSLPREAAAIEVHKHIPQRLQIVSPALL